MKNIQKFSTNNLRNAEDFGFMKRILATAEGLTEEADVAVVNVFKAAVTAFDEALKASATSAYTETIEAADKKVDTAWRGISNTAKAQENHPTAEVASAAKEVVAIIKKYGNVTDMAYNEEYGNIHNALQDFETLGTAKQKLCFIDAWVTELQTRYDEFIAAQKSRTDETAAKETGAVKKARTKCDETFKVLANYINSMVSVKGSSTYATAIDSINVIIDEAQAVLASRATRNGTSKPSSGSSSSKNDDDEEDNSSSTDGNNSGSSSSGDNSGSSSSGDNSGSSSSGSGSSSSGDDDKELTLG